MRYLDISLALVILAIAVTLVFINQDFIISIVFNGNGDNVYTDPQDISIELSISEERGNKVFDNLGTLYVKERTSIKVYVERLSSAMKGDVDVLVNGRLILTSGDSEIVINIPCMFYTDECVRILVVIPGIDQPLDIEPGTYKISLEVNWSMSGDGEAYTKLKLGFIESKV